MTELRILVIEHERGTGPERFGDWLEEAGAKLEICRPHLAETIPDELIGYAGLIVLGGAAGPLDDADNPWFPQVRDLLRRSAAGEFPSFNICLGGEMLAAATSGAIVRRSRPQIGVYRLHTTSAGQTDPVFSALGAAGSTFPAVLFHQEEMELPADAELLVTGSDAPVQAFRVGECAWGNQFHPETDAAQIARWLGSDPLPLPEGKTPESIASELAEADAALVVAHRRLAHAFVAYLRSRSGTSAREAAGDGTVHEEVTSP
ncbi:GMP synthase-like glutamine amidotransferase [Brevibacterium sanguinis]|uniref:GMP synthase-like glutamine amidotransferase n=2 Tax=Brevibacterium TaxID=1696 RepID=A0A366IJP3_9MICO|nr:MULTISPECIES: type 1 glutamine amidotransferase [Brevibacterium]RBP65096.1 GMP synthase-like glutamine amidotransferase [Brevibacterium sanguinis]RBP71359.1 GMP synthase-like glutamine amidotransferase [Brevibacterium celere]